MNTLLATDQPDTGALTTAATLDGPSVVRVSRNPYLVYLARLGTGSRPTMAEALDTIARMASGAAIAGESFPWH